MVHTVQTDMTSVMAVFGGQGINNLDSLKAIRRLHRSHRQRVERLLEISSTALQNISQRSDFGGREFPKGVNLLEWLETPTLAPNDKTLASAPISFPLNGIISLINYCVSCHVQQKTPGEMRRQLASTTGHSQGIIVAAAISGSDTWDTFYRVSADVVTLLFLTGFYSEKSKPIAPHERSFGAEETTPSSWMLSIKGLSISEIDKLLIRVNIQVALPSQRAYIALVNGRDFVVVAAAHSTLRGISQLLDEMKAKDGDDQNRVPFPQRRPVIVHTFLPVSAPFHTPLLEGVVEQVLEYMQQGQIHIFTGLHLAIPVYHTHTGQNLQEGSSPSEALVRSLLRMVTVETVDWHRACFQHGSHHTRLLDFGPGRTSSLLNDRLQGSGILTVLASDLIESEEALDDVFSASVFSRPDNWTKLYAPELDTTSNQLTNRFTKLMGTPPVMVAGMTPTTVAPDFVSAVMNAGYHVELAGGGYHSPSSMEAAIRSLAASIPSHRGIAVNLIYANPRAMSWQLDSIRKLLKDGVNIEGLTIGAGVPSVETAVEYTRNLKLKYIAFKPGSEGAIKQVLEIAGARPDFPFVLQWTGGRAGGHHSYEDQYAPLLATYGAIRTHKNVTLVVGGGLGDAHGMVPFFTGNWSVPFGYAPMPMDGILLGSRMMTAQEAHTSPAVKQLMVETPGTAEDDWYGTYKKPVGAGGILTVKSEVGEPIHKIANRAAILWRELEETIFNIKDPLVRVTSLKARKYEIIQRLNADYCKPWFAVSGAGELVELEDLTYFECLTRVINLMFIGGGDGLASEGWIDPSYMSFFRDLLSHILQLPEFAGFILDEELLSTKPMRLLRNLAHQCLDAIEDILDPNDAAFFMTLCRRRGQKPVNFIPKLDEDFETWFKKDSLWQSERLEAVPNHDPQRVCVIYGPVAAKYAHVVNEPARDILDSIMQDLLHNLSPCIALSQGTHEECRPSSLIGQKIFRFDHTINLAPEDRLDAIVETITGACRANWLHALVNSQTMIRDRTSVTSPFRGALSPGLDDILTIEYGAEAHLERITLLRRDPLSSTADQPKHYPSISISSTNKGRTCNLFLGTPKSLCPVPKCCLRLSFAIIGTGPSRVILETTKHRKEKIRELFCAISQLPGPHEVRSLLAARFSSNYVTITPELVAKFASTISRGLGESQISASSLNDGAVVPMDLVAALAWQALMKPLLLHGMDIDFLPLLHRSNTFFAVPGVRPLAVGDKVFTQSHVSKVKVQVSRKLVKVNATVFRNGEAVVQMESVFFSMGSFDEGESFDAHDELDMKLRVDSQQSEALLRSRTWFQPNDAWKSRTFRGQMLLFSRLCSVERSAAADQKIFSLTVIGDVVLESNPHEVIAKIDFAAPVCRGNPVTAFLNRHGNPSIPVASLPKSGWSSKASFTITIPDLTWEYSEASGDANPIHTCPSFAYFAGLPGPIVHGMFTSALIRHAIQHYVPGLGNQLRFRKFSTSFEGMIKGGERIKVEVAHKAMVDGRMLLSIEANHAETGDKVMVSEAEVEQPGTAYLFCGQGSQAKGMGIAMYEQDAAARDVWDRGDKVLCELYGFSLLEIVKRNPPSLTIYFGGSHGRQLRSNYLNLTTTVRNDDGTERKLPIFDAITPSTKSYTFKNAEGLLFSTQFAQPAISLMNLAELAALKARGLVQTKAPFAGHSLGEFSALAGCAGIYSVETLAKLTFRRGSVMQRLFRKDGSDKGGTDFGMVAVNPSRVLHGFDQQDLVVLVGEISSASGLLLEVVNFNVEAQQYVCAGHLKSLWILSQVLAQLSPGPRDDLISSTIQAAAAASLRGPIVLERTKATIPLKGVGVPFHSSYLLSSVDNYRKTLLEEIKLCDVDPDKLIGRYIPNVTGKVFSLDRAYVEEVARITRSDTLEKMLEVYPYF